MQTAKTLIRLGGVFAGRTGHFVGFVTRQPINNVNPDQTPPSGAVWSGSTLFA